MNSSLLVLCLGCSGFADCLVTLPQLLTFPVDHERDGVEHALLREAVDLRPVDFIQTVLTQAKHTCPNRRRLPKGGTSRRLLISIRVTLPLPELELSVAFSAS